MKGNKGFKVGRPSEGVTKKIMRSITSDMEIEKFLKEHKEINASELFRNMIYSMIPKDPDEIKLNNLLKRKNEIEQELTSITPEINRLKSIIKEREKLKIDTKIESDCNAWYLRYLIQLGKIKTVKIPELDPWDIYKYIKENKNFNNNEIEIRNNELYLTDKASLWTRNRFHDFRKGNHLVKIPETIIVLPLEKGLEIDYHIRLKYNDFKNEFIKGINGEMPLEFFKRFEPKITSAELKEEVKRMMIPEYKSINVEIK